MWSKLATGMDSMTKIRCKEVRIKNKTFCLVPKEEFLLMRQLEEGAVDAVQFANESIARSLKTKREATGLTQTELAKKARMRPEMISRIESGHGNPTVATIKRILRALGEE